MAPTPTRSPAAPPPGRTYDRGKNPRTPTTAAKWTCWVLGLVFLLLAILGLAGPDRVLGAFAVNTLHSWIHLLTGVMLFGLGFATEPVARAACWGFAAVYGAIMILGFAGAGWLIQALNLNIADIWLYLVMAILFVAGAGASHAQERTRLQTIAPEPGIRRSPSR